MLQNPFYLFFTACLGLFFWAGYRRIFAEVPYRHSLWSFLGEECAPGQRHAIVRALLAGLPGDSGTMAWILTMAALSLGGAGALFWYLVFSLLWLHPLGALAGLWRYYQPGCGGRVELSALLEGILCRKRARARPGLGRLLRWLQTLALCGMLPLLFRILASPSAPARGAGLLPWLVVLLALWLLCRLVGERGETVLSLLFLLLLAAALLGNLPNLIPAVKLVLLDAFDRSRFLFSLSGAGLAAALQAGGAAGCGGALLRTLSAREEGPSFAHPAQAAFYEELRGLLQLTVQLALAPVSVRPAGPRGQPLATDLPVGFPVPVWPALAGPCGARLGPAGGTAVWPALPRPGGGGGVGHLEGDGAASRPVRWGRRAGLTRPRGAAAVRQQLVLPAAGALPGCPYLACYAPSRPDADRNGTQKYVIFHINRRYSQDNFDL